MVGSQGGLPGRSKFIQHIFPRACCVWALRLVLGTQETQSPEGVLGSKEKQECGGGGQGSRATRVEAQVGAGSATPEGPGSRPVCGSCDCFLQLMDKDTEAGRFTAHSGGAGTGTQARRGQIQPLLRSAAGLRGRYRVPLAQGLLGSPPPPPAFVTGRDALSILKAGGAGIPGADLLCGHLVFPVQHLASCERAVEPWLDFSLTQMKNWAVTLPI